MTQLKSLLNETHLFPNINRWWEYTPEEIMGAVYWMQNKIPPSNKEAFERAWQSLKIQLQKKYPQR